MKYANFSLNFEDDSFCDKENAYANLGDNIQVLSIDYLYSRMGIDKNDIVYVNKDGTRYYQGEYAILPAVTAFWDATLDKRFPISDKLIPFFMSFVLNCDVFQNRPELVQYLKKYEPIGCRDERTMLMCRKYGIEAYITGCISLCFPKRQHTPSQEKVFAVDVSKELIQHIPIEILSKTEFLSHSVQYEEYPVSEKENERLMNMAKELLRRYYEEATMIITSRLHVAVPCVAMGIPVIFAANNIDFRFGWLDKLIKLYSLQEYEMIDWKPKCVDVEEIKEKIYNVFCDSIIRLKTKYQEMCEVSSFFENREKANYYGLFYDRVKKLNMSEQFSFLIWGAGQHGYYAYDIVKDVFPGSKLIAVVDKYKTGKMLGVDIIKAEDVERYEFDHVFITTVPGKTEAIDTLQKVKNGISYTFIMSQLLS